ncbi:MAG: CPBP family intramembrane metalloprotease, partial [Phycisphaerae bacterium]|nr:CPBP family intramembrane metalloprotease [Phycisphaerae bacterium]
KTFTFRIVAGLYLGVLFILRGFGVAVGTHVMWNIYVCVM